MVIYDSIIGIFDTGHVISFVVQDRASEDILESISKTRPIIDKRSCTPDFAPHGALIYDDDVFQSIAVMM